MAYTFTDKDSVIWEDDWGAERRGVVYGVSQSELASSSLKYV